MLKKKYNFESKAWKYPGPAGWTFLTIHPQLSNQIRSQAKQHEEGWGRLKVKASIHQTTWDTAIWFDTKNECYLLPLKAEVRKKEKIKAHDSVSVQLELLTDSRSLARKTLK